MMRMDQDVKDGSQHMMVKQSYWDGDLKHQWGGKENQITCMYAKDVIWAVSISISMKRSRKYLLYTWRYLVVYINDVDKENPKKYMFIKYSLIEMVYSFWDDQKYMVIRSGYVTFMRILIIKTNLEQTWEGKRNHVGNIK